MGSPSELSLDYKQPATMKSSDGGFLKDVLTINDGAEKLTRLNEITKYLEEERRKIDGFKRELPLCMHLLNDAIEGLKEEARQCSLDGPVLEEFMPIKKKSTDEERDDGLKQEKDSRDKMNWMSSAQLWSNSNSNNNNNSGDVKEKFEETDTRSDHLRVGCENPKPFPVSKHRNGSGAFLPFKANSGFTGNRKEEKDLADLSLSPGIKNMKPSSKSPSSSATQSSSQQPQRKSRRCWSTELHRRFVNALQQLGGCQVATPKQIKELMKVDGLTNDEVKSHLQKYRLHTKRPNDSVTASSATNQQSAQVVLLGGIWVPHEYSSQGAQSYHVSKQRSPVQSGSPQGPLQLAGNNRGNSGNVDSGGDEEDGKSECYSWKGQHQRSGEETD